VTKAFRIFWGFKILKKIQQKIAKKNLENFTKLWKPQNWGEKRKNPW
jgi:hypothetical protein